MTWQCVVLGLGLTAIISATICFIVNKALTFSKVKCDKKLCQFIKDLYEKGKIDKSSK